MELKEIRKKSDQELHKMLKEHRERLREQRFKVSTRQLKTVRDVEKTKKLIARILTILKERKDTKVNPGKEDNK
jgi:large subunit ribosomal protein L29